MTEKDLEKLVKDIKDLKIQGNTNIAKSAAKGLLEYITHSRPKSYVEFVKNVKHYAMELANARPNEPMMFNAMTFLMNDLDDCETQQQVRIRAIERIESFFKYIDESFDIIRENATEQLKGYNIFMTDCHSSLARDSLIEIHEKNPKMKVINTETRPMYQGRITAKKLSDAGIEVIHIIDSAVASILLDPRYPNPEVVLVGSDGITVKGDLVNKVGTYNLALAAKKAGVPFYAVSQTMKLDPRSAKPEEFKIEMRNPNEIWDEKEKPENVEILNPSFDLVPAELITGGFITEKGLLKPEDFQNIL